MAKRSIRKFASEMRKRGKAKKNGVLPSCVFDFGQRGPHTNKRAKLTRDAQLVAKHKADSK